MTDDQALYCWTLAFIWLFIFFVCACIVTIAACVWATRGLL